MAQPEGRGTAKRALRVGLLAFVLAIIVDGTSRVVLGSVPAILAVVVVLFLIAVHTAFDIIGTAVTAAEAAPLHAMASRKLPGAKQAIWMAKNAERVANFTNDVVGDVTGAVTGAAGTTVALHLATAVRTGAWGEEVAGLLVVALISGVTVGGKAAGKSFAMSRATDVLIVAGRFIAAFEAATGRSWTGARPSSSKRRST
jgi:CBS domain containing-hemolysin-like protein